MIKTVFLVPERDNDGQPFARDGWRELEDRLLELAGGFSDRAEVRGMWRVDGRVYQDVSREFTVSLTSWRQLPAWLAVVEWILLRFQQEALYVEVAGIPEIVLRDSV